MRINKRRAVRRKCWRAAAAPTAAAPTMVSVIANGSRTDHRVENSPFLASPFLKDSRLVERAPTMAISDIVLPTTIGGVCSRWQPLATRESLQLSTNVPPKNALLRRLIVAKTLFMRNVER
jgi:hypothetical protein